MADQNLIVEKQWILEGDLTESSGHALTKQLLNGTDHPTAVIAANDLMAMGVMAAAQALGIQIGQELSVVGFDDIPLAAYANPPLTTVHQPIYRIATMVTSMLIQVLNGHTLAERKKWLQPNLVVRQSTGPAPAF